MVDFCPHNNLTMKGNKTMIEFESNKNNRRERVFQMLFSLDYIDSCEYDKVFMSFYEEDDTIPTSGYIRDTFVRSAEFATEADKLIDEDSNNWAITRLSGVTRAILRLAVYELLCTDVPPKVAINEAVEISKKYGDEQEPSFINGILNKIARDNGKL